MTTALRTNFPTGGWQPADAVATNTRVNEHQEAIEDLQDNGGTPADNSVSTVKLQNNAVTKPKIADDAVGWAELDASGTPGATTFLKVAADGTLSAATPAGSGAYPPVGGVTYAELAAALQAAIDKANSALQAIPDNSVTKAKMADDAVGWAELDATGTPSATTFLKVAADGSLSAATPPGGGGGTVATVVPGNNIDVDNTDPANPIVSVENLTSADLSDFNTAVDMRVPGWFHALTAKTTLATSDELLLLDSAGSFGAVKMTAGNLASELAARMNQAQIKEAPLASSASTLTLNTTQSRFIHTGSGSTWTLPAITGNSNSRIVLDNLGSSGVTVQRAGSDLIYKAGTTVSSFTLAAGARIAVFNTGTYWEIEGTPFWAVSGISGTPDGTKFLRDDGTWATVTGGGGSASSFKTIADYTGWTSAAGGNWTAAMIAMAKDTHGNSVGGGGDVGCVVLPFGKGIFNGWDATVLGYSHISIISVGESWGTMLTLNAPLVDTTGVTLGKLEVRGVGCYAGTATYAIKVGTATDNGGRFRCIQDCEFWGFTARAISITGSDTPYFDIRRCTFAMGVGGIGIYAAGFTDNWVIDHNEFRAYKGAMHFDGLMSRMMISNNNFMHVSDSNTGQRYDVFFSASVSTTTARGQGVIMFNNWHGPEGRSLSGVAGDLYVVIADRTGTAPNFAPNLAANSTNTIHGLVIMNSTCFDMGTTPYVYSTAPGSNLKYCDFGQGCTRYGATGAPTLQIRDSSAPDKSNTVAAFRDEFSSPATPSPLAPTCWDGNSNLSATNVFRGFATTATAAGTTTLTVGSAATQVFTGTTTQTVKLPTTGVPQGASYRIINQSTGAITVQSSGSNTILTLASGGQADFMAAVATPTTAANWISLTYGAIDLATTTLTGTTAQFNAALSDGDFVTKDANANSSLNALIQGFTTTATAAATTTLTVASTPIQVFTGTTTQTVKLPTTSVLAGAEYLIINQSTGAVTVQSSGSNTIIILAAGTSALFTAVAATPTTAANWDCRYFGGIFASGKSFTVSNTLTLAGTDGTTLTLPAANDTLVGRNSTDTMANKTLSNPTITNYVESVVAIGTVGSTNTLSLTNGTIQTATLTSATPCTFTMPTAVAGKSFVLYLKQPSSGTATTATFSGVKWPTAGAPTITATVGKMDILSFWSDGTNWYGTYVQGYTY